METDSKIFYLMAANKLLIALLASLLLTHCKVTEKQVLTSPGKVPRAKNVILMIGDGMGLSQISAALYANNNKLTMEEFPVVGFQKTYAFDDLITDSAAGATAFSCGEKTYRFAIGMNADSLPCKTLLEEAEERELATGLIATSTIVHATPAAFIAHQKFRVMYEEIAEDFLKTEVDFVVGGGKRYFNHREKDDRDLVAELLKKNYEVKDFTQAPLSEIVLNPQKNFFYFTADKHPLSVSVGRDYLSYASRIGPLFLEKRSDKGFFLMIEGSQIDWAGHSNDGEWVVKEVLDFDRAVSQVLSYARRRGNTLVIVTADHETGGMAIDNGSTFDELILNFTTNMHTGTLVPVFAYGPGAEMFSGIYENTAINHKIRKILGFDGPTTTVQYQSSK
jgi:alkaline phosphatase